MKVRWGVLGAARIAVQKVIPALQQGERCSVAALASRDLGRAREAAETLGIPKAYGSYEELLADGDVEVVYNPLPNHLHLSWSIRALEAGKHVLCEKPLAMDAAEARLLLAARDRAGLLVQEAFMVRTQPRWVAVRDLVRSGRIGELRGVHCLFSYFNRDPDNYRHKVEMGGGGILDIGCYPATLSRFLFEAEPARVLALIDRDPDFGTDRLASAVLDFGSGHATFTCATQMVYFQRMQVLGTTGRIEIEMPFNTPLDRPTRLLVDDGSDLAAGAGLEAIAFPACNQYTVMGDLFSKAVREGAPAPVPLEDAVANMAVLDGLFRSGRSGAWERP